MAHSFEYYWCNNGSNPAVWDADDGGAPAVYVGWWKDHDCTIPVAVLADGLPTTDDKLHFLTGGQGLPFSVPSSLSVDTFDMSDYAAPANEYSGYGWSTAAFTVTNTLNIGTTNNDQIWQGDCSAASSVTLGSSARVCAGANLGDGRSFQIGGTQTSGTVTCGNNCHITAINNGAMYGGGQAPDLVAGSGLHVVDDALNWGNMAWSGVSGWSIGSGAVITAGITYAGPIAFTGIPSMIAGGITASAVTLPNGSPVDGSLGFMAPIGMPGPVGVSIGNNCTWAPGVTCTSQGIAIGTGNLWLGDMALSLAQGSQNCQINIGSGWKVSNGAAGGSVYVDGSSDMTPNISIGTKNANQPANYQNLGVNGAGMYGSSYVDVSGLGSTVSITGTATITMGNTGSYSGPSSFILHKKGAVVNVPGASISEDIPAGGGMLVA